MESITKEELLAIIKKNNLSTEQANLLLEMVGKGLGDSLLDLVELFINKTKSDSVKLVASMIFGALEPKAREAVKNIEIKL